MGNHKKRKRNVLGKSIQTEEGRVKIVGVIKDFNIGGGRVSLG